MTVVRTQHGVAWVRHGQLGMGWAWGSETERQPLMFKNIDQKDKNYQVKYGFTMRRVRHTPLAQSPSQSGHRADSFGVPAPQYPIPRARADDGQVPPVVPTVQLVAATPPPLTTP